ncbi:hypothetical protein [Butyrivibrio sp. VCB2006]|uniref:hypothetical protein n=1 Tax=Butyrivibrio sp. VCB2006 TaxID=1280679 RepID=UPI000425C34F|nr:hypothetical protein [Butyrivibrio sp. VCB2006]
MVKKTNKKYELAFTNFGYSPLDDSLYGFTDTGFLIKINCENYTVKYISPERSGEQYDFIVAEHSITVEGNIVFYDSRGTDFLVYDLRKNVLKKKNIPNIVPSQYDERSNILCVLQCNGHLIALIRNSSEIITIDRNTFEIVDRTELDFSLKNAFAATKGNKIYVFFDNTSVVKELDLSANSISELDSGFVFNDFQCVNVFDDFFYLLSNTGKVCETDLQNNTKFYDIGGRKNEFCLDVKACNRIWVFPWTGDDIYYIENGNIHLYQEYDDDFEYGASERMFSIGGKYINYVYTNRGVFLPARVGNKIALIDENGDLKWKKMIIPNRIYRLRAEMQNNGYVNEKDYDLKLLIKQIDSNGVIEDVN